MSSIEASQTLFRTVTRRSRTCVQQLQQQYTTTSSRTTKQSMVGYRTFFASSTDHTRLLAESEVHKLAQGDTNALYLYVMAAAGQTTDVVRTVPQLHLARIYYNTTTRTMYNTKVINRTLGSPLTVCGKLIDSILNDHRMSDGTTSTIKAKSTLHGLSDYIIKAIDKESSSIVHTIPPSVCTDIEVLAKGKKSYHYHSHVWEQFAIEYVQHCIDQQQHSKNSNNISNPAAGTELELFIAKGGIFRNEILHQADTSDYSNTSGGAMALVHFS